MKIDLLHYSAPPIVGGVESVLAHHARLMAGDGHDVRLLAGRGEAFDDRIPFISITQPISFRHPMSLAVKRELDQGRLSGEFEVLAAQLACPALEITGLPMCSSLITSAR
jgi:hypothetical protein